MPLSEYFTVIAPDDIRITGTRVGIETVLYDYLHRGLTPEAIAAQYPSLTLEQVYATITYYLHDQKEVTRYLANWLEQGHRRREQQARHVSSVITKLQRAAAQGPASAGAA